MPGEDKHRFAADDQPDDELGSASGNHPDDVGIGDSDAADVFEVLPDPVPDLADLAKMISVPDMTGFADLARMMVPVSGAWSLTVLSSLDVVPQVQALTRQFQHAVAAAERSSGIDRLREASGPDLAGLQNKLVQLLNEQFARIAVQADSANSFAILLHLIAVVAPLAMAASAADSSDVAAVFWGALLTVAGYWASKR